MAVRLYRALLALLPRDLRERFADDAADLFEDLYRAELGERGPRAATVLWLRSALLVVSCAVRARDDERRELRPGGAARGNERKGGDPMGAFLHDLTITARTLIKRPAFALTAVLILATGIGATTTIFSVVDTVVLRALPYPDAGQLVHFDQGSHSYPSFRAWQRMSSFEMIAAATDRNVDLTGDGAPERMPAAAVSEDFFRMFGGAPYLGRLFDARDRGAASSVVVLSHAVWERRWGADPSVVGSTLRIDRNPVEVVGVLDPRFVPPSLDVGSRVDLWFPLGDGGELADDHGYHVLGVAARLAPGVSLEAAQAEVDAQRAAVAPDFPRNYTRRDGTLRTTPLVELHEATVRGVRDTLWILLGAVGFMLLIACANVANLFLAHGTARSREIALRGALGASRGRIAGHVLTESLTLALVGGATGVALAYGGVELFERFNPGGIPRIEDLAVDLRVLVFTVVVSIGTGVLFGWVPALQAVRSDANEALKDGAASATATRRGRRLRSALVVGETALALVLLVGAGLLIRTFATMSAVEPGFRVDGLTLMPLSLDSDYDDEERLRFAEELLERIARLPGTESVALGATVPFTFTGGSRCCWRTNAVGDPALVDEANPFTSLVHPISEDYFRTIGARVDSGREFERSDMSAAGPLVAIVNRPAAEALFGTADPLGRTLRIGDDAFTVVGVEAGVHHYGLNQGVEPAIYVAHGQRGAFFPRMDVAVRSSAQLEALARELRGAVWAIDPDLPVPEITTMERRVSASLATPRFLSMLLGGFAGVALLLACGGIYGSMLYTVGQRRRELGIRLALGADGRRVIGLVLRYGVVLSALGIGIGTGAGLALAGVMESLLWQVEPTDPTTFVAVAVALAVSSLMAAFLPAWKASRTSPLETLRAE